MKKLLFITLSLASLSACAYPQPNSGIQIAPFSTMGLPAELQKHEALKLHSIKTNGYYLTNTDRPKAIMAMPIRAHNQIMAYDRMGAEDTHYKSDLNDIRLAFSYMPPPYPKPIGYAAIGSYTPQGWTGLKQVFQDAKLGICTLEINNMALTGGSIIFAGEHTAFDVNGKPTTKSVEGNDKSGFVYSLSWADFVYSYDMDCATQAFSKEEMRNMVILAKSIHSERGVVIGEAP